MTETQISADWAWISKDPAEGIGYGVLRTSAANVDFRPFIGRYVPGSPSSTTPADAPDAPPWVTFGPVTTEHDGVLMSVSVHDPWQDRDHVGRPVWPQRLFVMRFADLAAARASYQTMWAAVRDAQIPRDEPAPLPLAVSGQVPGTLADTVERYGLPQLAALAAALLDGPVVVSDAAGLSRDERLAVLDAIAALLPYGFRADLSASSVVDNTVKHGIRLSFADYPGAGRQLRSLRTPAAQPGSPLARRYLATLAEKADTRGLQAVVDHLWGFWHPHSFDQPGIALAILSELDFYGGFSRALREGRASRDQVLKFFADPARAREHWAAFDPQMRENAISPYLTDRDDEVLGAALCCWDFTLDDVAGVVNHHLGADGAGFGLWCLKAARAVPSNTHGPESAGSVADQLLGKMLVPVGLLAKDRSQRIAILVQLLRQCPVPGPAQLRYTCDELRFGDLAGWQAHLVRELLAQEAAAAGTAGKRPTAAAPADRVVPWIEWLCVSPFSASWERPSWVAALDFMLSPSADLPAVNVRSVVRQDAAWAVVLLRTAGRLRCFGRLLEAAEREFIELAAQLPAPAQPGSPGAALRDELDRNLWTLGVPAVTVAAVDVVRVLLGGTPRDLAGGLTEAELDSYGDGLGPALTLDVVAPRRAAVEEAFLGHVISGPPSAGLDDAGIWLLNTWATDPDRAPGLGDFIAALEPDARPYDENLSDAYWDTLARHPQLADYAAAQRLVTATRESVRSPQTAFHRRVTDYGITNTPLARACFKARCAGLRPAGIANALAKGGAERIAPRQLDDVLHEFQQLLSCHYLNASAVTERVTKLGPLKAAEADLFECHALIVWGALGEAYGEQFRLYLIQRWRPESLARRRLARILRRARRKRPRVDRSQWVHSVVQTGIGVLRRPWYQRWLRVPRREEDHASRA
jgi:hypothetical protein